MSPTQRAARSCRGGGRAPSAPRYRPPPPRLLAHSVQPRRALTNASYRHESWRPSRCLATIHRARHVNFCVDLCKESDIIGSLPRFLSNLSYRGQWLYCGLWAQRHNLCTRLAHVFTSRSRIWVSFELVYFKVWLVSWRRLVRTMCGALFSQRTMDHGAGGRPPGMRPPPRRALPAPTAPRVA